MSDEDPAAGRLSGSGRERRPSPQRLAVLESLRNHEGFQSAQEIFTGLRHTGRGIGLSTVYRHLQDLAREGAVDAILRPDGETAYGERRRADGHHHYLVCRQCGRVVPVDGHEVEMWASQTARRFGFAEKSHTTEIFGLCRDCVPKGA